MQHLSYSIGIDIGTGSTKAVALNQQGEVIASAQEHYTTLHPQPGYAEQDPEVIWTAFASCIATVVGTLQTAPTVVCFSSQMHSLLLVDEQQRPLTASLLWSDGRSAAIAQALRNSTEGKSIYAATGTPLHSMSPLCKLLWLKENEPALFAAAYKAVSIKEWIWARLFGVWEVDWSIASATGLFNNHQFGWDEAALRLTGLSADRLSTLVPTMHTRSVLSKEMSGILSLPTDTPFCIGSSDGCLANVGSAALQPGVAAVTIGTSAAVRMASSSPITDADAMPFSYVLDSTTFICGAPINNGGNVAAWLQQQFLDGKKSYDELMQAASAISPGSDGLLCLPYLHGERAPVWDESASGAFIGIKPHHTQAHFVRAALEGVCYSLRQIMVLLENNNAIQTIHASGGFVQSTVWLQLLADVTGKPVVVTQEEDASAIGAALWSWKAMNQEVVVNIADALTITPGEDAHAVYNRQAPRYQALYPALKPLFQSPA